MSRVFRQFFELWKQLGLNQKISLALATLAVIGVVAGVLVWSSRPDMQVLFSGLDSKDAGEVVSALEAQGIPYELEAGGSTICVPRQQVYRVRMDLASKGVVTGGVVGFEIFDRGNFGISDFVQRTNYMRAIQGELSRTVAQLDGVRSARVMVVMPENRLLVTDASRRSTASVLVDTGGRLLAPDAVNSIRSLVANAVEGLLIDDVVVVDNRGNVLSEQLRQESIGAGMTAGQIRYRKELEDYFSHKVETMLAPVVGPGNAVVRVSVDIDTSSSTRTEETFPGEPVLRTSKVTQNSTVSTESNDGSAVGVAANIPDDTGQGAAATGPTSNTQTTNTSKEESYEIGRSTTNTVRAAGEIRRLAAAVFVAARSTGDGDARQVQPRSPDEVNTLRQMVVNALGVVPARGQTLDQIVTVQEVDFAPDPVIEESGLVQKDLQLHTWIEVGRNVLFAIIAIFAFLYFVRLVRRSQAEVVSMEIFKGTEAGRMGGGELSGPLSPEMLNEMIQQRADNVSLTLKRWMSAEQK